MAPPSRCQACIPGVAAARACSLPRQCNTLCRVFPPRSFNNLYTLEGGIQNYMREEGLDHWNGSLFVFDDRMAIRPSELLFCFLLGLGGEG